MKYTILDRYVIRYLRHNGQDANGIFAMLVDMIGKGDVAYVKYLQSLFKAKDMLELSRMCYDLKE